MSKMETLNICMALMTKSMIFWFVLMESNTWLILLLP